MIVVVGDVEEQTSLCRRQAINAFRHDIEGWAPVSDSSPRLHSGTGREVATPKAVDKATVQLTHGVSGGSEPKP